MAMMNRCYGEDYQAKHPSYEGCYVCEEWLTFSNFKAWMEKQDWEGNELEKDLIISGNKIYSPETCVFVSARVNTFLIENGAARGEFPIGASVDEKSGKFRARCRCVISGKQKTLGYFYSPEEAHKAWLAFKLEQARILAAEQADPRVAKALIYRYENYN